MERSGIEGCLGSVTSASIPLCCIKATELRTAEELLLDANSRREMKQ